MPHWRGWLMATYLSCVVAPWTPRHKPGGKLKKPTSEHGHDYQSISSSTQASMDDDSSSPAPNRTMNANTIFSCGRCVIGTSQQPFICRDCVDRAAATSGQTCKRCLMLFDNVVEEISSNIADMSSQLPASPAAAAPRAPPPDPSAAGGAPRPAQTWTRVTASPPQQPLLLQDQDQGQDQEE